jgi:nicotinic acid phosphoribosyltransferase
MTTTKQAGSASRHVQQVKVTIDATLASAFREACVSSNVAMAAVISRAMADFAKAQSEGKSKTDYSTRRKRKAAIKAIVGQLAKIKEGEERYCERIPENLQGSMISERAEELVAALEEAIAILASV